jgi:hypothetical protein
MKSFLHSPLVLMLVSLLFLHSTPLFGQTAPAATKMKKIPFNGTIVAMDASAGTITLNGKTGRVLHITSATRVVDGSGNPTTLSSASVGEDVGGSYTKDASGVLTAAKLRIGAKLGSKTAATTPEPMATKPAPAAPAAETPPAQTAASDAATTSKPAATTAPVTGKKTRFSGSVTAVDASAGTLTIKTRTFTVTPASKIADSTGAAATLADVAVGTKVSGSYEKSPDGTMTVATLKIAK